MADNEVTNPTFHRSCELENGDAVIYLDGVEVLRVRFSPDNYIGIFFEKYKSIDSFLRLTTEQRERISKQVREKVQAATGRQLSDEEFKTIEPQALRNLSLKLVKQSIEFSAEQFSMGLPHVAVLIFEKIFQAIAFSGANQLRDVLEKPEEKYSAREIKDAIFQPEWEQIKSIIGITVGGAQNIKVNPTEDERKELGRQYLKLKVELKNTRNEYKHYIKQKKDWRSHLKTDYQVFIEHPDVLEKLDDPDRPKYTPSNLAIDIAARHSIKGYMGFSVSAKHLKELMILPSDNTE